MLLSNSADMMKNLRGGGQVVMWWAQFAPLVEIGLTDLPKSGGAMVTLAPTGL